MAESHQDGTSSPLTVDEAQQALVGLLSSPETTQTRETQPDEDDEAQDDGIEVDDDTAAEDDEADLDTAPDSTEDSEQTEEPDESEDADDVDDDADDAPSDEPLHTVKVGGEELKVTLQEALNGYSRTQDYTRKTMAHSAEVKRFQEEEVAPLRAERQQLAARLVQLEEALTSLAPEEPDWDQLREESPEEFAAAWAGWQQFEKRRNAARKAKEDALAKVAEDQRRAMSEIVKSERETLLTKLPEWKDPEVAKSEKAEMIAAAKSLGYTDEEIMKAADHRVLLLLRKAMLYDRAQKKRPAVEKKVKKLRTLKPGSGNRKKPVNASAKARKRLAKSGRVDDAAAAIFGILDD